MYCREISSIKANVRMSKSEQTAESTKVHTKSTQAQCRTQWYVALFLRKSDQFVFSPKWLIQDNWIQNRDVCVCVCVRANIGLFGMRKHSCFNWISCIFGRSNLLISGKWTKGKPVNSVYLSLITIFQCRTHIKRENTNEKHTHLAWLQGKEFYRKKWWLNTNTFQSGELFHHAVVYEYTHTHTRTHFK